MEFVVFVLALALVALLASVAGADSRVVDERHTGAIRA